MNKREYLIKQFIDEAAMQDFECSPVFNMDDESEILSVKVCDADETPIIEIHFNDFVQIETFDYYSEFRVTNRERNQWLLNRVNTLLLDL